jgi:S1-C subfamily serine protease
MADPSGDGIFLAILGNVAQVNDRPEEPEEGEPGPGEGSGQDPDEPETPLRGWIDPEDRLWRHPSEVTGHGPGTGEVPVLLNPPPGHPYRGAVMVLVGVVAVMAVVAWVVVLLSPASTRPLSTSRDTVAVAPTTLAGPDNAVPAAAQAAGRSMVELQVTTGQGTVALIGIAVAEGGLVATTADLLVGASRITMVGPGGKLEPATVVATDKASDVALVTVPEDLPVAPFADDGGLNGGTPDLTLSFVPAGGASVALHCTPGAVTGVATAIANGPAGGMPSISSSPAAAGVAAGGPLLNASGDVVGILYDANPGSNGPATFLPSQLVVGVADDLRSRNRVVHGWLGVSGADAPNGGGAKVETVSASGPAQGKLTVGQVIVGVNTMPVRTMAELRARLYVLAPGAAVALSVQQASGTKVVDLTLGGSS